MASLEAQTLNGWQRAALLVAGFAVAMGTYDGIDPNGGVAWIIGALVATALVVVGLKGVTSGRGPVLAVISVVCFLSLAGLGVAHTVNVQDLNAELENDKKAFAEKTVRDRVEMQRQLSFARCGLDALSTVLRSRALGENCGKTLAADWEREKVALEGKFIAQERAAGRDVRWFEGLMKDHGK